MNTELRYSVIHQVVLGHEEVSKAFDIAEYKKLKQKSKKFEELYKKYIKRIIKLIENELKSKNWRYTFIPIYIIDLDLKSCYIKSNGKKSIWKGYGDPITLLVMHEKVMLFTLIHELVHNLISLEDHAKWGPEKTEDYVHYNISQKVWDQLNLGNWRDYIKK